MIVHIYFPFTKDYAFMGFLVRLQNISIGYYFETNIIIALISIWNFDIFIYTATSNRIRTYQYKRDYLY